MLMSGCCTVHVKGVGIYAQAPCCTACANIQVYREPICRRHYSNLFSASSLLRIAVILGSIALAFLLAFATGGFWRKTSLETEQPTVHYTGDGLAIFEVGGFITLPRACLVRYSKKCSRNPLWTIPDKSCNSAGPRLPFGQYYCTRSVE